MVFKIWKKLCGSWSIMLHSVESLYIRILVLTLSCNTVRYGQFFKLSPLKSVILISIWELYEVDISQTNRPYSGYSVSVFRCLLCAFFCQVTLTSHLWHCGHAWRSWERTRLTAPTRWAAASGCLCILYSFVCVQFLPDVFGFGYIYRWFHIEIQS